MGEVPGEMLEDPLNPTDRQVAEVALTVDEEPEEPVEAQVLVDPDELSWIR